MDTRIVKGKNNESGTFTQTLSSSETGTAHVSPVPENAPGFITAEIGTSEEEVIYFKTKDDVAGTISGLTRDYTNLNGGTGREHTNGQPWETAQNIEYVNNLVDAVQQGYQREHNTIAYASATTFTVLTDQTGFYTPGRVLRLNQDNTKIAVVSSSSYSAGTGLSTVTILFGAVPNPLTAVEICIQPKGAANLLTVVPSVLNAAYAADGGASDDYAVTLSPAPTQYNAGMLVIFKANTANTGAATLDVNSLGAKDIKKSGATALSTGDISEDQIVAVVYDGTNFQLLTGGSSSSGTAFWSDVPGTPTRVSDTQFTITDTGNAAKYDLLFKKGVILKWLESTTFQTAMVISSSYSSDVVTINIVGDSLTAGFTAMKYCIAMAERETFIIPGTLATGTDMAKTWYAPCGAFVLSADAYVKTAGTTNATTFDINDDGSTLFTTKPSIASGATSDIDNVSTAPSTEVAQDSLITVDIDAVSTTPPVEAYLTLWWYPVSWQYRS